MSCLGAYQATCSPRNIGTTSSNTNPTLELVWLFLSLVLVTDTMSHGILFKVEEAIRNISHKKLQKIVRFFFQLDINKVV